ncbi:MAG: TIR domain-containing protein, partial [Myxococcota bacterium]
DALVATLEAEGFEVTIDRRDLPFGEEWQGELRDFILGSDTVIWLVSPSSVGSRWVNWELGEVQRAGKRLMRIRALYRSDDDAVRAAVADDDEMMRVVAINVVAERQLRAAIPTLVERVRDEKESGVVVVRAVGALVSLQATEATAAIIDTARRQSRAYLVPLLYALGQLGGRQAQAYLFTVQSGHPDPAVKAAATRALEELERRVTP